MYKLPLMRFNIIPVWLDRLSGNKLIKSNSVQATKENNQPVRTNHLTKQIYEKDYTA